MMLMIAAPLRPVIAALLLVAAFTLPLNSAVSAPRHYTGCRTGHDQDRHSVVTSDERQVHTSTVHPVSDMEAGCCGLGCNPVMPVLAGEAEFPDLPRDSVKGLATLQLSGVDPAGVRRPPKRSA